MEQAAESGSTWSKSRPTPIRPSPSSSTSASTNTRRRKRRTSPRKSQKTQEIKEIKMRPNIDDHDYDVKMKKVHRFIDEGDKVKVTLRFRGRELAHGSSACSCSSASRPTSPSRQGRAASAHGRPPDADGARAEIGVSSGILDDRNARRRAGPPARHCGDQRGRRDDDRQQPPRRRGAGPAGRAPRSKRRPAPPGSTIATSRSAGGFSADPGRGDGRGARAAEGTVLAFCRSGTRSTYLWALARVLARRRRRDADRARRRRPATTSRPLRPHLTR